MRILVVAVGSPGGPGLATAIREYEERAGRYFRFESMEVRAEGKGSRDEIRRAEGGRLLDRLPEELDWFVLTRRGKGMTSRALASHVERMQTYGHPGAAFVVGGAEGLSRDLVQRARYRLSLSPMTLPHELARLVLAEQLYRAGTIIAGEPYHREGP